MSDPIDPMLIVQSLLFGSPSTSTVTECESALRSANRLRSWLASVDAKYTARIRVLHEAGNADAASNVIAGVCNTSSRDAATRERRSKLLDQAKGFEHGLEQGTISGEHVDAFANTTAKLDDEIRDKVFDHEAELVDWAADHTPDELSKHVRGLAQMYEHDAGVARDEQQHRDTWLSCKLDHTDGMYRLSGRLHPLLGSKIKRAVSREVNKMLRDDPTLRTNDMGRARAEALGRLIDSPSDPERRPSPETIGVIIDYNTLLDDTHQASICETVDGAELPVAKVRQMACEAGLLPIVLDGDGLPLDVGRAKRCFTDAQRTALRAVYTTCAMHGCDTAFDQCEIHHIHHWEHGGTTDLNNGIPLCSRCHHLIHQPNWILTLDNRRNLTVTTPTGKTTTTQPDTPNQPQPQRRQRTGLERVDDDNRVGQSRAGP